MHVSQDLSSPHSPANARERGQVRASTRAPIRQGQGWTLCSTEEDFSRRSGRDEGTSRNPKPTNRPVPAGYKCVCSITSSPERGHPAPHSSQHPCPPGTRKVHPIARSHDGPQRRASPPQPEIFWWRFKRDGAAAPARLLPAAWLGLPEQRHPSAPPQTVPQDPQLPIAPAMAVSHLGVRGAALPRALPPPTHTLIINLQR